MISYVFVFWGDKFLDGKIDPVCIDNDLDYELLIHLAICFLVYRHVIIKCNFVICCSRVSRSLSIASILCSVAECGLE